MCNTSYRPPVFNPFGIYLKLTFQITYQLKTLFFFPHLAIFNLLFALIGRYYSNFYKIFTFQVGIKNTFLRISSSLAARDANALNAACFIS